MKQTIILNHLLLFSLIYAPSIVHSEEMTKKIFYDYRKANNTSFITGDTTHLRGLFSGDTETCWIRDNVSYSSPLVNRLIPENARSALTKIDIAEYDNFVSHGILFHTKPTHKLEISYDDIFFNTCANEERKHGTGISVYITINNNNYTFPALCPNEIFLENRVKKLKNANANIPKEISLPLIDAVLKSLTDEEIMIIRNASKSPSESMRNLDKTNSIRKKYNIGPATSIYIYNELCKKPH